jgi:hypothetical protein
MSTAARLRAGTSAHLREFVRRPLHVLFLVVLPPVVIEVYGMAMATFPDLGFFSAPPATMGRINGAVFAAAFLAGLVGLFQVRSAAKADERLRLSGFRRAELFCSRLAVILAVSLLATLTAYAVLVQSVPVEAPLVAGGALLLGSLCYGLIGILIGAVVPGELEGSLVLVFLADFDDVLSSGLVEIDSAVVNYTPLHYPHTLFTDAVQSGTVATGDVGGGLAYLAVLSVLSLAVYVRATGAGGILR